VARGRLHPPRDSGRTRFDGSFCGSEVSEQIAEPISPEARATRLESYAERVDAIVVGMCRDKNVPERIVLDLAIQVTHLRKLADRVRHGSRREVGR
jgi:hypothetical protein